MTARERIRFCETCGALTEKSPCATCTDSRRDASIVCVVERAVDILSIEKSGTYRGKFHVLGGKISDSIVCDGCLISGGAVSDSILSPGVIVERGALVEQSVIFDDVIIEPGVRLRRVIIDKRITIRAGTSIGYDREEDRRRGCTAPKFLGRAPTRVTTFRRNGAQKTCGDSSLGVGEDPIGAAASGCYHAFVNYLLLSAIMFLLLLVGAGYYFGGLVVGESMLGLILWTCVTVFLPGALNRKTS